AVMILLDIPAGADVFIDANIFIFYFRPDPVLGSACDQLLHRAQIGEIQGFTSASSREALQLQGTYFPSMSGQSSTASSPGGSFWRRSMASMASPTVLIPSI